MNVNNFDFMCLWFENVYPANWCMQKVRRHHHAAPSRRQIRCEVLRHARISAPRNCASGTIIIHTFTWACAHDGKNRCSWIVVCMHSANHIYMCKQSVFMKTTSNFPQLEMETENLIVLASSRMHSFFCSCDRNRISMGRDARIVLDLFCCPTRHDIWLLTRGSIKCVWLNGGWFGW